MALSKSKEFNARAGKCIAHGALTNSKRAESMVKGIFPTHLNRGHQCYVWDVDGVRYIDFICALGSNLLGYANLDINRAIFSQLSQGTVLSLGTALEVAYAERLKELFPVEKVRILKTGSEACSAAVRIARAYQGLKDDKRQILLSEGYHGWHDEFVFLTPPAYGVPSRFTVDKLPKLYYLESLKEAAAVIVEPIITDASPERIEWLRKLRQDCNATDCLLIFDETITGLRFDKLSVAKEFGIQPDLIILGKALGGGLPISVVGGRSDVMSCDYFVSSTFAGDTTAMAASIELLRLITAGDEHSVNAMAGEAHKFQETFNRMEPELVRIEGYPMRGAFRGDALANALFRQEMCRAGVLFGPTFFWQFYHQFESENVLNLAKTILTRIKSGEVKLQGEMPKAAYAEKVRKS